MDRPPPNAVVSPESHGKGTADKAIRKPIIVAPVADSKHEHEPAKKPRQKRGERDREPKPTIELRPEIRHEG